jgi:16S rRNA (guanine(966)-N(2))-methyltransferase RsmD
MSVRVISGVAKGCRLQVPRGRAVRPTPDRAKEGLFNIIGDRVTDCRFLDLYAGSGAIGIEALSRGATAAVFVERRPPVAQIIARNLGKTHFTECAKVIVADVGNALNKLKKGGEFFDIIFADPPYKLKNGFEILQGVVSKDVLNKNGLVIWEHASKASVPAKIGNMVCIKEVRYGDTAFAFLS